MLFMKHYFFGPTVLLKSKWTVLTPNSILDTWNYQELRIKNGGSRLEYGELRIEMLKVLFEVLNYSFEETI